MSLPSSLMVELETLAIRFAHLGVTADVAALTYADALGLLLMLRRLAAETI